MSGDKDIYETNLLMYCKNNPVNNIDKTGLSPIIAFMNEMTRIHNEVAERVAEKVGGYTSRQLTGIPGAGRHGGYGYPDVLVSYVNSVGGEVWEVKPDSLYGHITGPDQMRRYTHETGYVPGNSVCIEAMQTTFFGKNVTVTTTNGTEETGDKGVVYYKIHNHSLKPSPSPVSIPQAEKNKQTKSLPALSPSLPYIIIPLVPFSLAPSRFQSSLVY